MFPVLGFTINNWVKQSISDCFVFENSCYAQNWENDVFVHMIKIRSLGLPELCLIAGTKKCEKITACIFKENL